MLVLKSNVTVMTNFNDMFDVKLLCTVLSTTIGKINFYGQHHTLVMFVHIKNMCVHLNHMLMLLLTNNCDHVSENRDRREKNHKDKKYIEIQRNQTRRTIKTQKTKDKTIT